MVVAAELASATADFGTDCDSFDYSYFFVVHPAYSPGNRLGLDSVESDYQNTVFGARLQKGSKANNAQHLLVINRQSLLNI